jgi:hypothetical protein
MAELGSGNMLKLSPATYTGGKKNTGGSIVDLMVPAVLVVGSQYFGKNGLPNASSIKNMLKRSKSSKKR